MATLQTALNRPSGDSHATGKAYFETSTNKFIVWNGSSWVELVSDGTGAVQFLNRWGASFDGSDDKLTVSDSSLDISGDLTISFWFNANSFSNWNYLFNLTTFPEHIDYSYMGRSLGFYNGKLNSNTYYDGWTDTASTLLQTNTWYHAAVVYERTAGTDTGFHTIYLNGSVDLIRTPVNLKDITYVETQIGKSYNTNHFDGLLDDVAVWDSALSAADITAIYSNGNPTYLKLASSYDTDRTANLIGYWRMGDDSSDTATSGGSIATITDSSGNGNHATQTDTTNQPTFADLTAETIYV